MRLAALRMHAQPPAIPTGTAYRVSKEQQLGTKRLCRWKSQKLLCPSATYLFLPESHEMGEIPIHRGVQTSAWDLTYCCRHDLSPRKLNALMYMRGCECLAIAKAWPANQTIELECVAAIITYNGSLLSSLFPLMHNRAFIATKIIVQKKEVFLPCGHIRVWCGIQWDGLWGWDKWFSRWLIEPGPGAPLKYLVAGIIVDRSAETRHNGWRWWIWIKQGGAGPGILYRYPVS